MRFEIVIRNASTRGHEKTCTVEAENPETVLAALEELRQPVREDILRRIDRARRRKEIRRLEAETDFFDSMGNDISKEEYYRNEVESMR